MIFSELLSSRHSLERLLNLSATLAELTSSETLCSKIPTFLSQTLDLEPLSLVIFKQDHDQTEPTILSLSASGTVATGEASANFQRHILDICRQTLPLTTKDGPTMRRALDQSDVGHGFAQTAAAHLPLYPRQLVLSRALSDTHAFAIILHLRADQPLPSGILTESLVLVADQLTRMLACNYAWQEDPARLGESFERLTDREWVVLKGLNSEDGEKQLADRLHLSPHTLHSHIKSIYRKVGVQGRLPLLLKLNAAIREIRLNNLRSAAAPRECDRAVG